MCGPIPNSISNEGQIVPLYTLFMILGVTAFLFTTLAIIGIREKIGNTTQKRIMVVCFLALFVLLIGAAFMDGLFHSIEEGKIVANGITWLGGVFIAFIGLWLLFHFMVPKARGKEIEFMSYLTPGIALGHAFGRVGCFFGGCCFGKVTDLAIGVIYPSGSPAASLYPGADGNSLPVLPIQLFEAAFELILFIVLITLLRKIKKHHAQVYAIGYSVFRFVIEFFRGDDRGSTGFFLTPSQMVGILFIILALISIFIEKDIIFHKAHNKVIFWQENQRKEYEGIDRKIIFDLRKLKRAYEEELLTEEEYNFMKQKLLEKSIDIEEGEIENGTSI